MASTTSRTDVFRGRPPGQGLGINGSTKAHCWSVRSLGYRRVLIPFSYVQTPFRTDTEFGATILTILRDQMKRTGTGRQAAALWNSWE
jgi:hypothetical protein